MDRRGDHARPISDIARQLAGELRERRLTIATAESCTGGWVAKSLTDLPGSSAWFGYGFVTYSNAAKTDLLFVDAALLERDGSVSESVVTAMACGAAQRAQADLSVAISGIAGPDGGSADKPVGTVWFAWAWRTDEDSVASESRCERLAGDRDDIRRQSVAIALAGLLDYVARPRATPRDRRE